jgi:hypothetical protein
MNPVTRSRIVALALGIVNTMARKHHRVGHFWREKLRGKDRRA